MFQNNPFLLSVIVPLYNESGSLPALHQRLTQVLAQLAVKDYEVVFVDDGSRDATFAGVKALSEQDSHIKAIRFARNFGKEAAMLAGLRAAKGQAVVLIDGDLQHPPELIPQMVAAWQQGFKMVTAVRQSRNTDPWLRRKLTGIFYRFFAMISEVRLEEGGGDFRLFDRRVVDAILSMPERNRFMKGITSWVGFEHTTLPFEPESRAAGQSSFNLIGLVRYAFDGISAFSTMPLKIWSGIGAIMALISCLYGAFLVIKTIVLGIDLPGYASLMVSILFLSGLQLISLGVLGAYIGRVFTEVKARPVYLESDRVGFESSPREP